jgi:hypothetical protein
MRGSLLLASLCVLSLLIFAPLKVDASTTGETSRMSGPAAPSALAMFAQPQLDVDVDVGGRAWYENPVWIAIAILGVLVLVLLLAMALRGGGGPPVRD